MHPWQVELTKERKADPPDPSWVDFEYGNPGSFRYGLATLPLVEGVASILASSVCGAV